MECCAVGGGANGRLSRARALVFANKELEEMGRRFTELGGFSEKNLRSSAKSALSALYFL